MEWVAHRFGNQVLTIADAYGRADAIELDVHIFRGRLEVRHAKVFWPFARQWEKWEILPRDAPRPPLRDIVAAAPVDAHLWIDLKGFTGLLTRRALGVMGDRRPVTMSTRSWWALSPVRRTPGVRSMWSVGNRLQRWLVGFLRFGDNEGVVIHERLVDADSLARLHRGTPTVFAWGVTDAARADELRALGISGLIVDDLGLIDRSEPAVGTDRDPVG